MDQVSVVHAIVRQGDKFLLGKRSLTKQYGPGFWAMIGGSVEIGETLEECLRRECHEEIGVNILPTRKVHTTEKPKTVHHWFEVKIIEGSLFVSSDENSELKWFSIEELNKLSQVYSEDLEILRSNY